MSMRRILELQEPYRRMCVSYWGWGYRRPDYWSALHGLNVFRGSLQLTNLYYGCSTHGAESLLEWWQYWALRRIRSTMSQFVRRRVPRVAERYRVTTWRERLTGPTELFRVSNYVPGAANTVAGRKRSFSTMLDA